MSGSIQVTRGRVSDEGSETIPSRRPWPPDFQKATPAEMVGLLGHATFLYDDLTVAEQVRFSVRAGHTKIFLGASGAGKISTIAATTTRTGLKVRSALDERPYPAGDDAARDAVLDQA